MGEGGGERVCEKERDREMSLQIVFINVVERLGSLKSIERRGGSDRVGTHVIKIDKISKIQFWKSSITDFVQTITSWAPKTRWKVSIRQWGLFKRKDKTFTTKQEARGTTTQATTNTSTTADTTASQ